jgi:DNA-directed RNA polymerase subunit E'/Rpb7
MVALFMPIKFKTQVQLKPNELDARMEEHILFKLQQQYEGICSRHGFIKPGSLKIIERTLGHLVKAHFNGHIRFDLTVVAECCNPIEGMVVSATVKNKNQMGILAESLVSIEGTMVPVLDIIIPKRTAGISSEIPLDNLNVGDMVQVEVLGKRYQLNDKKISIIGRGVETEHSVERRRRQQEISLEGHIDDGEEEVWDETEAVEDSEAGEGQESGDEDGDGVARKPIAPEEVDKSPFDDEDESNLEYEEEEEYSEEEEYCAASDDDV